MSTQRMRDVLSKFRTLAHSAQWDAKVVEEHHALAMAEVEAVEQMARTIVEKGGKEALYRANYGPSVELLERIAKDAP